MFSHKIFCKNRDFMLFQNCDAYSTFEFEFESKKSLIGPDMAREPPVAHH